MVSREAIRKLPKIDLHRHWDGDLEPELIYELGKKSGIELPADNPKGLKLYFERLRDDGLGTLLRYGFGLVTSLLQSKENIYMAAYEEVGNLSKDNIIYAEIRFAPQYHTGEKLSYEEIIRAFSDGLRDGEKDFMVKTKIIVCIGREAEPKVGIEIAEAALNCMDYGVVAIDIACDESRFPPERHLDAYKRTFGTQLKRTAHAGEFGDQLYKNMVTSIKELKADRLGHARTIAEHDELVDLAASQKIGIELCPESNLFTGLIKSRKELKIGELLSRNVLVSVNSDDPAMFRYTLTDTIHGVAEEYGFGMEELKKLQMNAIDSAFLSQKEKARLKERIEAAYTMKGLVVFDLDGVLVKEKSSWISMHEHFGTKEQARENLDAYKAGKISYDEFMRRDISLWPRAHADEVDSFLSGFTLAEGARETITGLKEKGYEVAIISAGIDILAKKVAKELDIPYVLANGLEFDRSGHLTGCGVERVALGKKEKALESLTKYLELEPKQCIAVGDSEWDVSLLASAGLGVAYGDGRHERLDEAANLKISDLRELLDHF